MLSFAWFCKRNGCERLSSKLYETSISRDVNSSGERFTKAVQTPNVSRTQKKTRRFRWPYVFIVTFQWSSRTENGKQLIAPPISCSKMQILVACLHGPVTSHFASNQFSWMHIFKTISNDGINILKQCKNLITKIFPKLSTA